MSQDWFEVTTNTGRRNSDNLCLASQAPKTLVFTGTLGAEFQWTCGMVPKQALGLDMKWF